MKTWKFCLSLLAVTCLLTAQGWAQEPIKHMVEPDQGVHQWLTQEAWRYYNSQIENSELGSYIGTWEVDGIFANTEQAKVLDGARDEDKAQKPPLMQGTVDVGIDMDSSSMRHFCDGADNIYVGLKILTTQYDSALGQAEKIWRDHPGNNIMQRLAIGDKTAAYYYLGHVCHLLEDMTVPTHTHNDPHGATGKPLHDNYEQDFAAFHFQEYHYENEMGGEPVLSDTPITVPASLYDLFLKTADYTDDYDSCDEDGEWAIGGEAACFYPTDYPSHLLHRPGDALRSDGEQSMAKCQIIGDDLMYWAIKQTAHVFRWFYSEADKSLFEARAHIGEPDTDLSLSETDPTDYAGPTRCLITLTYAGDGGQPPISGIVKSSRRLHYAFRPEGGAWQNETVIDIPATAAGIELDTQKGLYKFWADAENGAGTVATSQPRYMRVSEFSIARQPRGGWFEEGTPLRLEVDVAGASIAAQYQWLKDGSAVGGDDPVLEFASATPADSGTYVCRIVDGARTLTTQPVKVLVVQTGSLPVGGAGLALAAVMLAAVRRLRKRDVIK